MNKYVKKGLIGSGIFVGVMILLLIIIAAFFEGQISKRLVKEINKQLKTELKVEQFELSLISGFPKASANLRNVQLDDALQGTLLEADKLSFRFGLFSLFGSDIKIHSVVMEDGSLYVKRDKKGKVNYDIFKKSNSTSDENEEEESSSVSLSLDEAQLNRMEVIYVDQITDEYSKFHINKAVASGNFSSEKFSLMSFADITSHFYRSGDEKILIDEDIIYDAKIAVDFANGTYGFEDVSVGISSNVFNIDGTIETVKKGTKYDLKIDGKEGSLSSIFALLPAKQQRYFSDFDSEGIFYFNSTIKGIQTRKSDPAIFVEFGLDDGKISSDKLENTIKDVSFTAKFTNGKQRNNANSSFEIKDFKGKFNKELFKGKLRISNLDNPLIDFSIDGVLPLESIHGLFNSPMITDGDGEVELKNLRLKGRYKDIISPSRIAKVSTSGAMEFDDAELKINDQDVVLNQGLLTFKNNSLKVKKMVMKSPGNNIRLDGTFRNILPVLFADKKNSKKAELKFTASLDAEKMDLDKLLAITSVPVEKRDVGKVTFDSIQVAKTQKRERITNFLKGKVEAKIDDFNYNKIEAENFRGTLEFDNNEMAVKGKVNMMDGRMIVDSKTFFEDHPRMEAKLTCERIDIKKFFYQAESFGQKVLTDKNIKGKLDAKFFIEAFWDDDATFLTKKLRVLGDVGIANGELVNLKMLYDFADYIKIQDLRRIKFTELHNYMEVKKGKLYLPAMFIQSNAMNMTVSGTHTFENKIDYNIKVNAGQILWNKFKKHNRKLRPQKAKKRGFFNMYYRIYGPIETFTYKSDKKGVKRSFDLSDNRKRRVQKELRKHFGDIVSIEEPSDWKDSIPELDQPEEEGDDEDIEFIDFDDPDSDEILF